jgi:DNA-binding NarL/FixJ family response regulator
MQHTPIRIILADDHPVILKGIRMQLAELDDMAVVADARSFASVLPILAAHEADVLILDVGNMGGSPISLLSRLAREYPQLKIVIFSSTIDLAPELLDAGAHGYVAKEDLVRELVEAIRAVAEGTPYLSETVKAYFERRSAPLRILSPKELTVLKLLALGHATNTIAEHMGIDPRTVQNHITRLRDKTGCVQRTQLVDWYRMMYEQAK